MTHAIASNMRFCLEKGLLRDVGDEPCCSLPRRCPGGDVVVVGGWEMSRLRITRCIAVIGLLLGLSACTNPYDPVQRTIGGGLIGAGSGAAIGAAAAGGHGAALGAAVGGAVGALGGLITTPPRYRY
jgi:hypothetical protein